MTFYVIRVAISVPFQSVSCPASPEPPQPDHRADYRSAVLRHYTAALSDGLSRPDAIRKTSQVLKSAGHPWHYLDLVRAEVSSVLGPRSRRSRRGQS